MSATRPKRVDAVADASTPSDPSRIGNCNKRKPRGFIRWIGLMKFTPYEAVRIQPLVATSPLMAWMYGILPVRESAVLGQDVVLLGAAIWTCGEAYSAKASGTSR